MTDRIPIDVLETWLTLEAIARIERCSAPSPRARQVDEELGRVGLVAEWDEDEHGPILIEVRRRDAPTKAE